LGLWGAHHKLCVPWFGNGAHEHMTFMCKNFKLMKKQFLHDFHYPIMGYKVYNTYNFFFNVKMDETHTNKWNYIILGNEMTEDQ
jgi:hypothetical protein